eukprot:Selendium_serpulae@DN5126_c0_g1_i3.p1
MSVSVTSKTRCWSGTIHKCEHVSQALGGLKAQFQVFVPDSATPSAPAPHMYCLAGLTSTDENFLAKSGAMRTCSQVGLALVCPDTSPRGAGVAGEEADWDIGTGAGFFIDAAAEPWSKHYRMADYIVNELPKLIKETFPMINPERRAAFGHSMGGHGAIVNACRHPGFFKVIITAAPIANPSNADCPWGQKNLCGVPWK